MVGTPWRRNSFPVPPRVPGPGFLNPPSLGFFGKPAPPSPGLGGILHNSGGPIQPFQNNILSSHAFGRGSPLSSRQRSNDRLTRPQFNSPGKYNNNQQRRNNNVSVSKSSPRSFNSANNAKKELQEKALKTEVSKEFYDRVKAVSIKSKTSSVALEFAQKKFCKDVQRQYPMTLIGSGGHTCSICKVGHTNRRELESHYETPSHKHLEGIYDLFKEQAMLIFEGKIKKEEPKKNVEIITIDDEKKKDDKSKKEEEKKKDDPDLIINAEKEMNLNAKDLDLDGYILGIYESVMRQYWPVPKSNHYCRICNYAEFSSETEHDQHLKTKNHKDFEASYDEAFCLYCQHHNASKSRMMAHEKTDKHNKVKDLMDTAKELAIKRWHTVNKKPLPKPNNKSEVKTGSKRTNSSSNEEVKTGSKQTNKRSNEELKTGDKRRNSSSNEEVKTGSKRANTSLNGETASPTKKRNGVVDAKDSSSKTESKTEKVSTSQKIDESTWFVPVNGVMCIACRKFLASTTEQKSHANLTTHRQAVEKFKQMIISGSK